MRILVIGSGGREHALVWKIAQSPRAEKIYAAPGNPGIAKHATCVDIMPDNVEGLAAFAAQEKIDLTVVGPEAALANGVVDEFRRRSLRIFGPTQDAAELESSKVWCKNLLRREGIPSGNFRVFDEPRAAMEHVRSSTLPVVIKADGLAAGKGVAVCRTESEADAALKLMMEERAFGHAADRVIVEEFLSGVEASVMALTDGRTIYPLEAAQDHKRLLEGDRGPNTGGMGAYSPAPVASERDYDRVVSEIIVPTIHAMSAEGRPFQGLLYAGIMFTRTGPRVLEFNVRFGDPETQPLMMRLKSDLVDALEKTVDGRLEEAALEWDPRSAVCVVMASQGYPGRYDTGAEIEGVEAAEAGGDAAVFHAGTARRDGQLVTSGGRVLGVTALGDDLAAARTRAYDAAAKIRFHGAYVRRDIGARGA